ESASRWADRRKWEPERQPELDLPRPEPALLRQRRGWELPTATRAPPRAVHAAPAVRVEAAGSRHPEKLPGRRRIRPIPLRAQLAGWPGRIPSWPVPGLALSG